MPLIGRDRSVLVVIDLQERLLVEFPTRQSVIEQSVRLVRVAHELAVPVLATEQYPKGLGPMEAPVTEALGVAPIEKVSFGCMGEPRFAEALKESGRRQLVIVGAETHVCVLQTALSALASGYEVFVVADAVASRRQEQYDAGLDRLRAAGVGVVTVEMVIFEWLGCAGTAEFKRVLPFIKER